jgi:hypothetical protein
MADIVEIAGSADALTVPSGYGETPLQQVRSIVTPDDYNLEEVYIITSTGPTNLKSMMVELSYYEDIFKGMTSGNILINDSIDLIDRLGISGFDYIKLKFSKSIVASKSATIEKYFRVYRVSERIMNNNATETYTLHFCSEELLLSEQTKISKGYSGKKISEMIFDVLNNHLRVDKKFIRLQETDGIYDFTIPFKKPLETINWLSNYARPIGKIGSDFVFFENSEGFNFFSLQNLFSQTLYNSYVYVPRNLGSKPILNNISTQIGRDLVSIKMYSFLDTFDTLYGITTGAFSNRLITVDPLTRTYRNTNFDYKNYFNSSKSLNNFSIVPNLRNRLGKTANECYDSVLKVSVSNSQQKKALGINDKPWAVTNDIFAENYIPNRTAQMALSHYSRLKISLSGDPNLTVGMIIEITLPSNRGGDLTGYQTGQKDVYNSGKYMITAVRHVIDVNNRYETILEVVKDSFGGSIDNYLNSDELENAIKGKL